MTTEGKKYRRKQHFFSGEWRPDQDPLVIAPEDYSELQNYEYRDPIGLLGVPGYTKINTTGATVTPGTYYKGRSGIQLRTPHTVPSYVLVQALNAAGTASAVLENRTAIPDQGNFESSVLHEDDANAGLGRFAHWPQGHIAYCNGVESMLYPGDEMRCSAFIVSASETGAAVTGGIDYSEEVQNTLQAADQAAMIGGENDAYAKLLMHFDEADGGTDFDDSSPSAHNPSGVGTAQVDSSQKKFGIGAGLFDGNSDWVTVANHADWDISSGDWTIDLCLRSPSFSGSGHLCSRENTVNPYNGYYITVTPTVLNVFYNQNTQLFSLPHGMSTNTWHHVAVVNDGSNITAYIDGVSIGSAPTVSMENYAAALTIGARGDGAVYFNGWIDEFRFSKGVARWTANFTPPAMAYRQASLYWLAGFTRPLKGVKKYLSLVNAEASPAFDWVKEWSGDSWAELDITDNTTGLSQSGTITWPTTKDTSKVKLLEGMLLYWYQFKLSAGEAEIYHVTGDPGWQSVKDLWGGTYRVVGQFRFLRSSIQDRTIEVNVDSPAGADASTSYTAAVGGLLTSEYIDIGLEERTCGLYIKMFEQEAGKVNTNASVMTVEYWNGEEYTAVVGLHDGTASGGKTLAQTGTVSWDPPAAGQEKVKNEYGMKLYYCRITVSANLSATVLVDLVGGIPAPRSISGGYKFPFMFQGHSFLCGYIAGKEGHRADYGAGGTVEVFNGDYSSFGTAGSLYFGKYGDLTCACQLYNRFGSTIYNLAIFCKATETYILTGYGPDSWRIRQLSDKVGCASALTMDTAEVGFGMASDVVRNIALWLSYTGPIVCDAGVLLPIEEKISCYFDKDDARCINFDAIANSRGWVDQDKLQYNLGIPSGSGQTSINVWLCLDLKKMRWFEKVPAGDDAYPQAAFRVADTNGTQYVYGLRDNGYMMRLENGTTWDGEEIAGLVASSDQLPTGDIWDVTKIRRLKMLLGAIAENSSLVGTHYKNGKSSGTTLSPVAAVGSDRYVKDVQSLNLKAFSHKFEFSIATSNTVKGVPLLAWGYQYEVEREDVK